MIPKIIHCCWLSDDPMPLELVQCMESWKRVMPSYEIRKWDLKRFPLEKSEWVRQAFEAKKYAFAADYIRLYALYTEGGVYLDCDVEVLKSFDDFLHLPYFICQENSPQGIEAGTIGAEKGCSWVEKCLDYYESKNFIDKNGKMETRVLPSIVSEILSSHFETNHITDITEFDNRKEIVNILPSEFFSPKSYVTKKIVITEKTYSIHHFAGTWQPLWKKMALRLWVPFSVAFPTVAEKIKRFMS